MELDLFAELRDARLSERLIFGEHWCMVDRRPDHGEEVLCAVFLVTSEDGKEVRVYRTALPAVFYRLETDEVSLSTGSGMAALVVKMAEAMADGMLGLSSE